MWGERGLKNTYCLALCNRALQQILHVTTRVLIVSKWTHYYCVQVTDRAVYNNGVDRMRCNRLRRA